MEAAPYRLSALMLFICMYFLLAAFAVKWIVPALGKGKAQSSRFWPVRRMPIGLREFAELGPFF
jgi:hypothetical protein